MQHYKKPWSGWGALASVALHLSVAFLLLFRLSEALPKPPEEAIKVEVVPPAPPKPPEKTQNKPAESKPQPAPPLSPPAATGVRIRSGQDRREGDRTAAASRRARGACKAPIQHRQDASPAKPETEPSAEKAPSSTKSDLPKLDLPVTDRGDVPRKDEAPTAQQVSGCKSNRAKSEGTCTEEAGRAEERQAKAAQTYPSEETVFTQCLVGPEGETGDRQSPDKPEDHAVVRH